MFQVTLILFPVLLFAQECAKNPYLQQFEDLITILHNQNLTIISSVNSYLASSTSAQTTLKTCSQFAKASCCTPAFEDSLETIVQLYYQNRKESEYPFTLIMNTLENAIQNCAVRDTKTFQLISAVPIVGLSAAIFNYRKQVASLIQANMQFLRGNLCILCASPTDFGTYIKQSPHLQLIIDKTSYESYISSVSSSLKSLQDMIPTFKKLLNDYFTQQADTITCSSILQKLNQYLTDLQFCVGGDCTQHIRNRVNVLKQEIDEELLYILSPDFGFATRRLLSEADSFVESADGTGLKTFIIKDTDKSVSYQGVKKDDVLNTWGHMMVCSLLIIASY